MGTGNLNKLASPPTEVKSSTEDLNQILDALYGDVVMRNTSGVVTDGAGDIGQINGGRPDRIHVKTAITVGGQTLNTAPFLLSKNGIQSGSAKTSGFPQFLEAGGGTSKKFSILGATTNLEMTIDGQAYSLEVDLESDDLALAPGSNNTCAVNDALFSSDPEWSKTVGEFGYWINIDTVGSEITSLDGTVQCFKHGSGPEVFLALVDTTNNRLVPILRGIGGTDREAMSDNDVITLLQVHFIFLKKDLLTIGTTKNYPVWSSTEPGSPVSDDRWYDAANQTWMHYNGSTWEQLNEIYIGYAICDSAGCKWVENVDFDLNWNQNIFINQISTYNSNTLYIDGSSKVSVAGENVVLQNQNNLISIDSILEDGVSVTEKKWYYLYMSKTANYYFSDKCPRKYDDRLGLYHPKEYWRCIGVFFTSNMVGGNYVLHPGINKPSVNKILFNHSSEHEILAQDTGINDGSYDLYNVFSTPIASSSYLNFRILNNGGNISGQFLIKEFSRFTVTESYPWLFSAQRDSVTNYSQYGTIIICDLIHTGLLKIWKLFNGSGGSNTYYIYLYGCEVKF